MLLFISFLIVMVGCVNWLLIGLLQYDFVAGIFGYQGSMFSRIIYIIIGAGAIFFMIKIIMQKGKIELFNFRKKEKRDRRHEYAHVEASREHPSHHYRGYENDDGRVHNVEVSSEHRYNRYPREEFGENLFDDRDLAREEYDNLFDEHFSNDN